MRLLIVSKRRPQQRDLVERPYGRFHHLPAELAALGHDVQVLLCSHRNLPSLRTRMADVEWLSHDVRTLGPLVFFRTLKEQTQIFQPDWVIGMSDAQFGWLAWRLARSVGAKFAVDAYDNYEAYMAWNLPLHRLWRRSIREADLVTAAGPQLALLMQSHRKGGREVETIPMVADPEFVPVDRMQCRLNLGLSTKDKLIGYVGSWAKSRGTPMLIEAFRYARLAKPEMQLLVSGHPPREILDEPGVVATGYVADRALPELINALDVACVITANTRFGRYSYPAKLCEAMACNVPVAATATDPVRWMLNENNKHLAPLGDADTFAQRILENIIDPHVAYGPRETWGTQAKKFAYLLSTS